MNSRKESFLRTAITNRLLNAKYFELIDVLIKQGHSIDKAIEMADNITSKTAQVLEDDLREGAIDVSEI
jgi:hypothetical protein